jgi:hypothetical protein
MNLFSSIATAAALTIAPLTALEASAGARTGQIQGYVVEIVESGSWSAPDFITVYGPRGKEQITVTCSPFDWSSYGANSTAFANSIAYDWCF